MSPVCRTRLDMAAGTLLVCIALAGCAPSSSSSNPFDETPVPEPPRPENPVMKLQPEIQFNPAANIPAGKARYSITDLGVPLQPTGINDAGQIIAHTENNYGRERTYLIENGKRTPLGDLPGCNSTSASAINNRGQIVGGSSGDKKDAKPFLWEKGTMTPLPILPDAKGWFSSDAINEKGQILGNMSPNDARVPGYAVLWPSSKEPPKRIGLEHGDDINDSGVVVGTVAKPIGNSINVREYYRLDPGNAHAVDLGLHAQRIGNIEYNAEYSRINNSGTIVCTSWLDSMHCSIHLFPREGKSVQIVKDGLPFGLNSKGQAVGLSGVHDLFYAGMSPDSGSEQKAFLYVDGKAKDLDSQIAPNSGWHLQYATAINNKGQIVGIGTFKKDIHGFLLTPRAH